MARHKSREGRELLAQAIDGGEEIIDGRTFKKIVLPVQAPPPKRNQTSRYHLWELRGDGKPPEKKRRRKSKSRRRYDQREKAKRVQ